jgi:integrase
MTNLDKSKRITKILNEAQKNDSHNSKIGIRFYERAEQSKGGQSIIYLSVTYKGKTCKKSTGITCRTNTFEVPTLSIQKDEISTTFIQKLNAKVKETITEFRITDRIINPNQILKVVFLQTNLHDNTPTFNEILEYILENERKRLEVKEIGLKTFKRTLLHIVALNVFHLSHFKTKHIELSKYLVKDAKDYKIWLKLRKGLSEITIKKYLQLARKVFYVAIENKWHDFNPYSFVKVKVKQGVNLDNWLTQEELKRLHEIKFLGNPVYEQIRDAFLFQCYTGLRYSDIKKLRIENIKEMNDTPVLAITQQKTSKPSIIPLFRISLELLKKNKDSDSEGFCFKTYSQTHHNRILKELAVNADISKNLSTHTARRTFGNLMVSNGLSKESLQAIFGHSTITMTEKYYTNTSAKRTIDEMNLITKNL